MSLSMKLLIDSEKNRCTCVRSFILQNTYKNIYLKFADPRIFFPSKLNCSALFDVILML